MSDLILIDYVSHSSTDLPKNWIEMHTKICKYDTYKVLYIIKIRISLSHFYDKERRMSVKFAS